MKRLDRQTVTARQGAAETARNRATDTARSRATDTARNRATDTAREGATEAGAPGAAAAVRTLALLLVIAAPPLLLWGGWSWMKRTPGFAIRHVEVAGTVNMAPEEVVRVSGALGANGFALDLAAVRSRLLSEPWIAEASVSRALPHDLRISVSERQPAAIERQRGASGGASLRVLDAGGRVLSDRASDEGFALPEITGLSTVPENGRAARRILGAATLAALKDRAPSLFARAESLDVSDAERLVLTAKDAPPIWLSGPDSADEAAAWSRRENGIVQAITRAAWVDARWRDRLYVMPARS